MINWIKAKLRQRRLKKELERFVSTLAPERQEWARQLSARLEAAATPEARQRIILQETEKVHMQHIRLTEKIERLRAGAPR